MFSDKWLSRYELLENFNPEIPHFEHVLGFDPVAPSPGTNPVVRWQERKANLTGYIRSKYQCLLTGPDSLVVRASASGSEGRGFAPRPRHTKGVKNGTGSALADTGNKRVVLGRYKNADRYLLLVMSH